MLTPVSESVEAPAGALRPGAAAERTLVAPPTLAGGAAVPAPRGGASRAELGRVWRRFVRFNAGVAGGVFILFLVVLAVAAPVFAPYSPTEVETSLRGASPSRDYWLGNDSIGRDILSRLIYGTRVALLVGLGAMSIALTIGVSIGA